MLQTFFFPLEVVEPSSVLLGHNCASAYSGSSSTIRQPLELKDCYGCALLDDPLTWCCISLIMIEGEGPRGSGWDWKGAYAILGASAGMGEWGRREGDVEGVDKVP